jgi:predicted DNA-binding transcriptional regulator AlpA
MQGVPNRVRQEPNVALQVAAVGDRLLTMKAVIGITSWSRTSINRLVREGHFPSPIKLGIHKIAFRESDVRAYMEARLRRPTPTP